MQHISIKLSEYTYPVYQDMAVVWDNGPKIAKALTNIYGEDRIQLVCRGSSGILIAQEVQRNMPKGRATASIHYARKDSERAHNYGMRLDTIYPIVIIDDIVCTGETLRAIRDRLRECLTDEQVQVVCAMEAWNKANLIQNTFPSVQYIFS